MYWSALSDAKMTALLGRTRGKTQGSVLTRPEASHHRPTCLVGQYAFGSWFYPTLHYLTVRMRSHPGLGRYMKHPPEDSLTAGAAFYLKHLVAASTSRPKARGLCDQHRASACRPFSRPLTLSLGPLSSPRTGSFIFKPDTIITGEFSGCSRK